MKQRISGDDLKQLSPEQQEKLREWWNDHRQEGDRYAYSKNEEMIVCDECRLEHGYDDNCYAKYLPLLSIGQLIQLLDPKEETIFTMMKYIAAKPQVYEVSVDGAEYFGDTMCDCLWQAARETVLRIDTEKELAEKERQEKLSYIRHCQKCFRVFNLKDQDFFGDKKCPHCGGKP